MRIPVPAAAKAAATGGLAIAMALALGLAAAPARAADAYPSHAITLVVPTAPGGNIDFTARTVADVLARALGQPVVIDNRAGAGSALGAAYVARARPDGYTLLLAHSGSNAVMNAVSQHIPYDGVKSFTIVGGIATNPSVLTISSTLPVTDFAGFRKYAATKPGGVSMGSAGNGSFTHLMIELLRIKAGLPLTVVPYKGTGPAATDLMGHTLDGMVDQITTAAPLARDGRVRAIAQLGPRRSPLLPDVPTLAEQGFPGVADTLYTAIFAPAHLPAPILQKLSAALKVAMDDPGVQSRLREQGADPIPAAQQAGFPAYAAKEARHWADVAREAHVSIDE